MSFSFKKFESLLLSIFLVIGFFFVLAPKAHAACTVTSMAVRPNGIQPIAVDATPQPNDFPGPNNPNRNQGSGYPEDGFDSQNPGFPPYVYVDVATSGCMNSVVSAMVVEPRLSLAVVDNVVGDQPNYVIYSDVVIGTVSNPPAGAYSTTQESFTFVFRAGENATCDFSFPDSPDYDGDCAFVFGVYQVVSPGVAQLLAKAGNSILWPVNSPRMMHSPSPGSDPDLGAVAIDGDYMGQSQPALSYACDFVCNEQIQWSKQGVIAYGQSAFDDNPGIIVNPSSTATTTPGYDSYLAPLPGINNSQVSTLGGFLQSLFSVLILIAGILAFIMIVIGGVTYATSDAFSGKESGKEMIMNAILGLIIALGSWVILNTINPNLASNLSITIPKLTLDQKNYADYESKITNSGGFTLIGTFDAPTTSPNLSTFLDALTPANQIASITVNTSQSIMTITNQAGGFVAIPVTGLGANGVSEVGEGVEGDKKTPKGSWQISSDIRIADNVNDAQAAANGGFNMGPAFIGTNITDTHNGHVRGIGIHGNSSNNPSVTMGCIRLKNDDVLALARKIHSGVTLTIQ